MRAFYFIVSDEEVNSIKPMDDDNGNAHALLRLKDGSSLVLDKLTLDRIEACFDADRRMARMRVIK
jgi:hypothetical protein